MIYAEHINVMLLTRDFFSRFTPAYKTIADSHTTTEVMNALQLDSKQAVDAFFDKAISA